MSGRTGAGKDERVIMGAAWGEQTFVLRLRPSWAAASAFALLVFCAWSFGATAFLLGHRSLVLEGERRRTERTRVFEAQRRVLRERSSEQARWFQEEAARAAKLEAELHALRTRKRAADGALDDRFRAILSRQAEIERRQRLLDDLFNVRPKMQSLRRPELSDEAGTAAWLEDLSARLRAIEEAHRDALFKVEAQAARRADLLQNAFAELGVEHSKLPASASAFAQVETPGPSAPAPSFDAGFARASLARAKLARLRERGKRLPITPPVSPYIVTSPFGIRRHPFLGRRLWHSGVDLRAARGQPVRAAAPGRVAAVTNARGYGRLVVLDHGDGIVTRYAHLLASLVRVGQRLEAGAAIGRAGSSGRSTGPHLHFETRMNGEALDPTRFRQISSEIRRLLK